MPAARGPRLPHVVSTAVVLALLGVVAAGSATRLRSVTLELRDGSGQPLSTVAPGDLRVFEGQAEQRVTRIEPVRPGDWQVLVYADALAAGAPERRDAAAWLAREAERLVALGPVTLVVADTLTEPWLEDENDADAVGEALLELGASEFSTDGDAPPDFASWRRGLLIDTLVRYGDRGPGPKLLVVVGDANGERVGSQDGADEDPERALLAASAATLDWVALVLRPAGEEDAPPPSALAEETGGAAIGGENRLREALAGLSGRLRVDFSGPAVSPDSGLLPLTVVPEHDEWSLRATRWSAPMTANFVVTSRARYFVTEGQSGDMEITAVGAVDTDGSGREEIELEVLTDLEGHRLPDRTTARLRLSLVVDRLDDALLVLHATGQGRDLGDADSWLLQLRAPSGGVTQGMVVVVEDLDSGAWGAAEVELEGDGIGLLGAGTVVESIDLVPEEARDEIASDVAEDQLIRILPPKERSLSGTQTFRTMTLNAFIRRVVFYLDGTEVAEDLRHPFSARIDLGELAPHRLEAIAFDRAGNRLGGDVFIVNRERESFEVEISALEGEVSGGRIVVRAGVSVPFDGTLDRAEVWWNDELRSTSTESEVEASLAVSGRPGAADFVRVVAYLTDGTSTEDVRLLGVEGVVEEVEVNLVEIFAVAIDEAGEPVRDLEAGDFRVLLGGDPVPVERFGLAEDLPLALGLVIDTSQSMDVLLQDARVAAIKFLSDAMGEGDVAFLVDFDSQPRLAQAMTRDLGSLVNALGSLVPGGNTALYDSILFSLLHFEETEDRRALVLLTDGDDYRSRFTERRAALQARSLGVPVYLISLAALDTMRPSMRKSDLEYIARLTGGEVFYVNDREQLSPTYGRIVKELRSQYVMAFSTARELSDKEIEKIEVKVGRPGLRVRAVVAGRSVQTR